VTQPTFAAERQRLQHGTRSAPAAIDICCPRGVQQQTHRTPLMLSIDGTDRYGRTSPPYAVTRPSQYYHRTGA